MAAFTDTAHADPSMIGMPPVSAESRAEAEAWISRGQTLEDFQKTRNAPGALYSVAGNDTQPLGWNAAKKEPS